MPRSLSDGALRRAESVFERLARLDPSRVPEPPAEALSSALAPWREAAARGDSAAFARRLEWDRVAPALAAAALADSDALPAPAADPEVERWLRAVAPTSSRAGRERAAEVGGADLPFAGWVEPWTAAAEERLRSELPAWEELLAPAARASWVGSLRRRLGWIAALPLYSRFDRVRRLDGAQGVYGRWLDAELAGAGGGIFEEFPLLARQLAGRAEDWIAATHELVGHLVEDRAAIAERFGGPEPGRVAALDAGLSDPHARGRRVVALRFESGLELVYKPRSVALEAWLEGLLRSLAEAGLESAPPAVATLDRSTHGWQARVAAEELETEEEAEAWFRAAGALAAIAWIFGARDLHAENLIATRRGPAVVDAEMLLAPRVAQAAAMPEPFEGVAATGLVADPSAPAGPGALGYAGLAAPEGGLLPEADRRWSGVGSGELWLELVRPEARPLANLPRLAGRIQLAEAFAERVVEGFERAARFLAERGAALAAPDGPLARSAGAETRVLFRPSAQYGGVLALLVGPRYLADGRASSLLLEALLRIFAPSAERPLLWPLVAEERRALERLDVPVFRVPVDSKELVSASGERIEGWFARSGLDAARARLLGLDERAIGREREALRRALAPRRLGRAKEEAILLAAASTIAAALAVSPRFAEEAPRAAGLRALSLYGGALGRALFAAGAFRATGGESWRGLAERIGASVGDAVAGTGSGASEDRSRPGGTDGWGSLIWGFVALSGLLEDPRWIEGARGAADALEASPEGPARWGLDLAAGEAGAVLGLLALAEVGEARALDAAIGRGERLIAAAGPEGAWSPPGGGPPLAGIAHGAAGIARAFDALAPASGEERFAAAAAAGRRYEQALFDGRRRDWPALVAGERPGAVERRWLASWCHGAPGVALDRALRLTHGEDRAARAELDAALETAARSPLPEVDHLCCGSAGRIAALAAAGRWLGDEERLAAARSLARRALARAESRGGWTVPDDGPEGERPDLGFFRGYPGLAWCLVGLTAAGASLPVVAALELPSELRRRRSGR